MNLSDQTIRRLLRIASICCVLASALLVARAFRPAKLLADINPLVAQPESPTNKNPIVARTPEDFASLLKRPLGAPLYDSNAVAESEIVEPEAEQEPEPVLIIEEVDDEIPEEDDAQEVVRNTGGLRVIGTVIESGKSLAIFADSAGEIQLGGEGDLISFADGDGRVTSVELNEVIVSIKDETLRLKAP